MVAVVVAAHAGEERGQVHRRLDQFVVVRVVLFNRLVCVDGRVCG